jgi:hypothetical protein
MDPTQTAIVFAHAKVGTPFVLALSLGLTLASGAFLLRPWPPRLARGGMFALVLALCGAAMVYALIDRRVVIEPSTKRVVQSLRLLGLGRDRAWTFGELKQVRVEYRPAHARRKVGQPRTNATDVEIHPNFVLELVGDRTIVDLRSYDDARGAETMATRVASAGRWPALRRGYRLRTGSERESGGGITAGALQGFKTASGQQGIGLSLEPWEQVVIEDGAESAIEPVR